MNRSRWIALVFLLLVTGLAALLVGTGAREAESSAVSRGSRGWLAARRYLEARGVSAVVLDRALDHLDRQSVLVAAFPWQSFATHEDFNAVERHLRLGGFLIYGYAGTSPDPQEIEMQETLDLKSNRARGTAPLNPLRWRRFVGAEWRLVPDASLGKAAQAVVITAPVSVPVAPAAARVLYRGEGGVPAVFTFARWRGQVMVLPADAFANCRIGENGNGILMESIIRSFERSWVFDEFHHGLRTAGGSGGQQEHTFFDYLMLHLALLYGVAVLAVVKRFGPVWREGPAISGSTASFLLGLGSLHDRLGHHGDAARALWARAQELDPEMPPMEALPQRAHTHGRLHLLEIAKTVANHQQKRRRTSWSRTAAQK